MFRPELMAKYPKTDRSDLLKMRSEVSEEDRRIAKRFDWWYFDSTRKYGYGGYHYHPRFFSEVAKDFVSHYGLKKGSKVLDVGCGKGFLLHDLEKACPGLEPAGVDISAHCLANAIHDLIPCIEQASCENLPFEDKSFDLVVSISTIHNLKLNGVRNSLREIQRVSRGNSFIKVNGYRNLAERENLERWNLVAETILRDEEWEELFAETGYTGDWDFFRT